MQVTNRKFGIEIEFVGVSRSVVQDTLLAAGVEAYVEGYNHTTRPYWKIVSDSSLHHHSGLTGEVVSPILQGNHGLAQLKKVCEALNSIPQLTVNRSCGLHIHLDCQDMTVGQIAKTFERYAKYEDHIDMVMPRSRRGSARWCASIKGSENRIKRCGSKSAQAYEMGRYYKVNLTNVATRGAMEFRQHSGTTDFRKISNWLIFLQQFVETSIQLAAVHPVSSKSRWYNQIRNALEKQGFNVTWSKRMKQWEVTKEGSPRTAYISNDLFNLCYHHGIPDSAYKNQKVDGAINHEQVFMLLCQQLQMSTNEASRIVHDVTSYKNHTTSSVPDNSMTQGISQEITNYLEERKEELN